MGTALRQAQHGHEGYERDDAGSHAEISLLILLESDTLRADARRWNLTHYQRKPSALTVVAFEGMLLPFWPIGNAEPRSKGIFTILHASFTENFVSKDACPRTGPALNPQTSPQGQERQLRDAIHSANRIHFDARSRRRASATKPDRRPGLPGSDGCRHSAGAGKPLGVLSAGLRAVPSSENCIEAIHSLPE
jgi:hypothetical protein